MIDAVRAIVEPHIDHIFRGGLRAVVEDTGGAGLCKDASLALIRRVGRGHLLYLDLDFHYCARARLTVRKTVGPTRPLPGWARRYREGAGPDDAKPGQAIGGHVVAVIDGVIVDLTARQFRADLPFPMYVEVPDAYR